MKLTVSMASHRGRVRTKNEDNFYAHGRSLPQVNQGIAPRTIELDTDSPRLFGVFDGMGGYSSGERASFLAVQAAHEIASKYLTTARADSLMLNICSLANQRVCDEMLNGENERIGTTASMVHIHKDTYTVCNVGDSPIFLLREGVLTPIHQEHSERANYEKITGKPAPPNKKFRLTQNIGIFAEEMLIEPYCASTPLQPGDLFLLCSDGVTDMVSAERIRDILAGTGSTEEKTGILLNEALNNGGKDNITIVMVEVEKPKATIMPWTLWIGAMVLVVAVFLGSYFFVYRPRVEANSTKTPTQSEAVSSDPSQGEEDSTPPTESETKASETESTEEETTTEDTTAEETTGPATVVTSEFPGIGNGEQEEEPSEEEPSEETSSDPDEPENDNQNDPFAP